MQKRHKRTFSEDEAIQAQKQVKQIEVVDDDLEDEPEDPMMLQRDAKDWKVDTKPRTHLLLTSKVLTQNQEQDHYAVLGISKLRHRATEDQIRRAHRKKVMKHHPDKKAQAGGSDDDSFFKCISKAAETLLDPSKRRAYDSVDEAANVEPPTKKETQKGNFYTLWGRVMEAEGRFSKTQPVPTLGDEASSKEHVEAFYNFFYNFDSWRTFEYLDEDVPDDGESRDQKRHVERKNNNARKKHKTEDTVRRQKLVDECLALDERIKRFKTEEHAQRNKKRLDREAAAKAEAEAAAKQKEDAARLAAEQEEAAKAGRAEGKKAKEAAKNAAKKNKRVVRGAAKDAAYFGAGEVEAAADVDEMLGALDVDELADFAGKLNGKTAAGEIKGIFVAEVKRLEEAAKLKAGQIKTIK